MDDPRDILKAVGAEVDEWGHEHPYAGLDAYVIFALALDPSRLPEDLEDEG